MQTAAYTTVKTATNGEGKYPLSTQTLEFIQQQILLLQEVVAIAGGKVILKEPDGTNTGLLALDGEVLPIAATPQLTSAIKYVYVITQKKNIEADGEIYKEARTVRTAKFASATPNAADTQVYKIGDFTKLTTNTTLAEKNQQHAVAGAFVPVRHAGKQARPPETLTNATQGQIDGLKNACVVNCTDSVAVLGFTNYCITVKCAGSTVEQVLTTRGRRLCPSLQQYHKKKDCVGVCHRQHAHRG